MEYNKGRRELKVEEGEVFLFGVSVNEGEFIKFMMLEGKGEFNFTFNEKFKEEMSEDSLNELEKHLKAIAEIYRSHSIERAVDTLRLSGYSEEEIEESYTKGGVR